jgi:tetratricopeptide (TPR) repeat protein
MTDSMYSVKDVAQLFELQEARLRYWAQTGFIGPSHRHRGKLFYSFQDLIGVKVAKELLESGVPMQRVRRNLEALRAALPGVAAPLAQLKVVSDGNELYVVDADRAFQPESGQLVMSFAVGVITQRLADVTPIRAEGSTPGASPTVAPPLPRTAFAAFQAGLEAEDAEEGLRAEHLYRHAVRLDPGFSTAWTNLGNLLECRGAKTEAREAYERALDLDPEQPEARYNLANLLADMGDLEASMVQYRRVIATAPDFADAHYNLGLVLARLGAPSQAGLCFARYLELDPGSEWAARAREQLGPSVSPS